MTVSRHFNTTTAELYSRRKNPQGAIIHKQIFDAILLGDAKTVAELIEDPRLDLNAGHRTEFTLFEAACWSGVKSVIDVFLTRPHLKIDYDCRRETTDVYWSKKPLVLEGSTIFWRACCEGDTNLVRILCRSNLCNYDLSNAQDISPLECAAMGGHTDTVMVMMETFKGVGISRSRTDARAAALEKMQAAKTTPEHQRFYQIMNAIYELDSEPSDKIRTLNKERKKTIGLHPGKWCALMVYISDGYLKIPKRDKRIQEKPKISMFRRFMNISARLPIELQMVLSQRACGSSLDLVTKAVLNKGLDDML